jgi:hypothetical protein
VLPDVPFAIWPGRLGIGDAAMLSDVEAAVSSQAGVLEQAGILDLPFVKSRAAGPVGRIPRAMTAAGNRRDQSRAADGQGFRRFGPQYGLLQHLRSAQPPPQAILRQADFKAIPSSQRSLRLAVRTRPSQG